MKLKFINLSTADFVLTYLRTGFYIVFGVIAFLNYWFCELRDYEKAPHLIRQILWIWFNHILFFGLFTILILFLTVIVALSFTLKRSPGIKYSDSDFHFLVLSLVFMGTLLMLYSRIYAIDTAGNSVVRVLSTEHIQGMAFADFIRIICINSYLKRCLLKAQEKA
jgi:hypothetical protein